MAPKDWVLEACLMTGEPAVTWERLHVVGEDAVVDRVHVGVALFASVLLGGRTSGFWTGARPALSRR